MRTTGKIVRLLRSFALCVNQGLAKAETGILKGYPAFTGWNVARMLVMGALLSAGAIMYLNMASEGKADAPIIVQDAEARPADNAATYIGRLFDDDEWRYGPPYVDDFRSESVRPISPPISREVLEMYQRIDDQWRYRPPYMEDLSAGGKSGASNLPADYILEDELWKSPYYQDSSKGPKSGPSKKSELRIVSDDEWRYGPPYIQVFPQAME